MPDPGRRRRGLPVGARRVLPHRPRQVGAGHRPRRRRQAGHHRGHRPVRADAAARDRAPGWIPLPGPPHRPARPRARNAPSSPTAGAFPACRGCRARGPTRSVTDGLVARPRDAGDGSLPPPRRFGPAADRCGGPPAGDRPVGAGADEDRRGRRVRARRCGRAAGADRRPGAHLARSARSSMPPPRPGPAPSILGWTAGCCGPDTAPRSPRIPLCRWIFRLTSTPSRRSSTGTTSRGLTPRLAIPDRLLALPPGLTSRTHRTGCGARRSSVREPRPASTSRWVTPSGAS